eukprot:5004448-Prymnesium_polylepis.1
MSAWQRVPAQVSSHNDLIHFVGDSVRACLFSRERISRAAVPQRGIGEDRSAMDQRFYLGALEETSEARGTTGRQAAAQGGAR